MVVILLIIGIGRGKTMNSINTEFLQQQIADTAYHQLDGTTITITVIKLHSGFTVTGESACVDPNNFDVEIGKKIAYENAFDKLWQLFGFELKQKIGGDWIYRLQRERNELAERLDKLKAYLDGMKECDPDRLKLLNKQVGAMDDYLDILNQRLAYV